MVQLASDGLADATALLMAIKRELPGILTTNGLGDSFVFYDPDGVTVPEKPARGNDNSPN